MAKDNNNNPQYLANYANKLRRLNDYEIKLPQAPIEQILKDPLAYAQSVIQREFELRVPNIIKAFYLGKELANTNLEDH